MHTRSAQFNDPIQPKLTIQFDAPIKNTNPIKFAMARRALERRVIAMRPDRLTLASELSS